MRNHRVTRVAREVTASMRAERVSDTNGIATPGANAPTWWAITGTVRCSSTSSTAVTRVAAGTARRSTRWTTRCRTMRSRPAASSGTASRSGRTAGFTSHAPHRSGASAWCRRCARSRPGPA
ncbi:hypothetical protein [Ornithinimicrobium kibberense]|uniref:hypothetical protein n=1 Tax=Ornithinimicrobium kibberense TaxID=282060 RepID=UPI00360FEE9C